MIVSHTLHTCMHCGDKSLRHTPIGYRPNTTFLCLIMPYSSKDDSLSLQIFVNETSFRGFYQKLFMTTKAITGAGLYQEHLLHDDMTELNISRTSQI